MAHLQRECVQLHARSATQLEQRVPRESHCKSFFNSTHSDPQLNSSTCQNPYEAFRFVDRLFTYLTMKKRSGHFHQLKIPHRESHDLTVSCMTCPQPGLNIPPSWRQVPERLQYVCEQIFLRTSDL